jgi:DNA-binding transcriptional ArsR family regulator
MTLVRGTRDPRRIGEALRDPLRSDVFDALTGWLGQATAARIAEFLRVPPAAVEQALAVLVSHDLVEPLEEGPSPAFRATQEGLISDEEWAEFPAELRRTLLARNLEKMHERIRGAVERGGFDAADVHLSWVPTDLDELGYQDMVRLLTETLNRAQAIQAAVVERRATGEADESSLRTDLMMLHFLQDGGTAAPAPPRSTLERAMALSDSIADEVASETTDWQRIAAQALELAELARRRGTARVVR